MKNKRKKHEGWYVQWPKRHVYGNNDEVNSPNEVNSYDASPQKYSQKKKGVRMKEKITK